ncbi:hypothetical protein RclHR1_10000008 [Rhizophagus clarus]|uniref:Chromo domain-containing protein n=1 Tax=Rhizophagus clarus TaxID=94130 RepID=A0A2Z6Q1J3_9GLOM|nr:hypothetical protein RclHR1_10000008 [Rhizophagus clarus]
MPIDPKGYHYFLVVVEISRRRVDAEPIKNKTANSVLKAFIKIYGRGRIQPSTHRLETDSGSEFTNSQILLGKKLHGKFRIGDIKWDPKVRIIKKLILSPEQPPTYLLDGPHGRLGVSRCAYTRKELQVIPANEKPPPDSVIRGRPERYVPERIIKHRTRKGQLQYLVKWERYPEDESTWEPADRLQEDVPNLVHATPEWVENWLNAPIKETGHTINASIERTDIFQIHEIARNIIYHLDQLAEEDYWKAVMDYKNSDEELEHAFKKYLGTNRALKDKLYKKFMDLANKKEKAFAYQVEIEKIMLQGGFVYKKEKEKKDHIFYNIRMLADGLDPYEIPVFRGELEEPLWQSDYWGDEDPDDSANWQSEYSEDPSDFDEPNESYLEYVE